jgi:hypothetical protein
MGTSVDVAIGVVYGMPDHSGAPGTPAVWTLRDWLESGSLQAESPSLKNRKAMGRCPARTVYRLHAIG